jgi:hypothetical protein
VKQTPANLKIFSGKYFIAKQTEPKADNPTKTDHFQNPNPTRVRKADNYIKEGFKTTPYKGTRRS